MGTVILTRRRTQLAVLVAFLSACGPADGLDLPELQETPPGPEQAPEAPSPTDPAAPEWSVQPFPGSKCTEAVYLGEYSRNFLRAFAYMGDATVKAMAQCVIGGHALKWTCDEMRAGVPGAQDDFVQRERDTVKLWYDCEAKTGQLQPGINYEKRYGHPYPGPGTDPHP